MACWGKMEKLNLPWEAGGIRFVLFLTTPLAEVPPIWQMITGGLPEVDEHRPRDASRRIAGPFGDHVLEVTISPVRIDIAVVPFVHLQPTGGIIATAGLFEPALDAISAPVLSMLEAHTLGAFNRLAFNASLFCPTTSNEESYATLSTICKSANVEINMRDFLFRVNWRKNSKIGDVDYYNRLTSFSALFVKAETGSPVFGHQPVPETNHYAVMELDINTSGERVAPLENSLIVPIFRELMAMAHENLSFGEVRE